MKKIKRAMQLVKMQKVYGYWYNQTPYWATEDEEKQFAGKLLGEVNYLIRKSNRAEKYYGTNELNSKYIPANIRRVIGFYDKNLLELKGGYIQFKASHANYRMWYPRQKTYWISVCHGNASEYAFSLKHNVTLYVSDY